jgi:hypothetical protein
VLPRFDVFRSTTPVKFRGGSRNRLPPYLFVHSDDLFRFAILLCVQGPLICGLELAIFFPGHSR